MKTEETEAIRRLLDQRGPLFLLGFFSGIVESEGQVDTNDPTKSTAVSRTVFVPEASLVKMINERPEDVPPEDMRRIKRVLKERLTKT